MNKKEQEVDDYVDDGDMGLGMGWGGGWGWDGATWILATRPLR